MGEIPTVAFNADAYSRTRRASHSFPRIDMAQSDILTKGNVASLLFKWLRGKESESLQETVSKTRDDRNTDNNDNRNINHYDNIIININDNNTYVNVDKNTSGGFDDKNELSIKRK